MKLFSTLSRTRGSYNVHTLLDEAPVLISIWINLILFIYYLFIFVIFSFKIVVLHPAADMDIRHTQGNEGILSAVRCKTETSN